MLRMPQNLTNLPQPKSGLSVLETELRAEQAATLGRLGHRLQQALERLRACPGADTARPAYLTQAAQATWHFFIQRELCGLVDHTQPIEDFHIPNEVLAQVGAQR